MIEKVQILEDKLIDIQKQLVNPEVMSDTEKFQKLLIEHGELEPIVEKYRSYKKSVQQLEDDKQMLQEDLDDEMRELLESELEELSKKMEEDEFTLKTMLIPKDPNDEKNVIVEIRAGAGGDEAGLFAGVLFRLYTRYAERQGWRVDIMKISAKDLTLVALFSALIAVGAFIKIPFLLVPITLQTLFIVLSALVLERKLAVLSVIVYIMIGLIGFPIFANVMWRFQSL